MKNFTIEIKWAIIFVAMSLLWMLLEKLAGLHGAHIDKHYIFTNFMAVPAIAVYVFALLDKRRNFFNGEMTYKQGFISGLIITLIVTILSPLTQIITTEIITPEFFPNVIAYAVEKGEMTQEAAEEYFSLKSYIMQGLFGGAIMGIITSAIVAFFVKTKIK